MQERMYETNTDTKDKGIGCEKENQLLYAGSRISLLMSMVLISTFISQHGLSGIYIDGLFFLHLKTALNLMCAILYYADSS